MKFCVMLQNMEIIDVMMS